MTTVPHTAISIGQIWKCRRSEKRLRITGKGLLSADTRYQDWRVEVVNQDASTKNPTSPKIMRQCNLLHMYELESA